MEQGMKKKASNTKRGKTDDFVAIGLCETIYVCVCARGKLLLSRIRESTQQRKQKHGTIIHKQIICLATV